MAKVDVGPKWLPVILAIRLLGLTGELRVSGVDIDEELAIGV